MKNMQRIGDKERQYVNDFLDTQFRLTPGSNTCQRLEEAFAKRFESKFAISHTNGTATLHSCLAAVGVGPGDEVIVPPLTMSATAIAVLHQNAVPVFADVDERTFQIDPESIRKLITPRTKAIITVALYGLSPDMDPIMEMAREKNIPVIEDDAECFMGTYKGRLVGTIGDMASFSFQRTKQLTAGEGGIVITNNEEYADRIRQFTTMGYVMFTGKNSTFSKKDIQDPNYNRHGSLGWNYQMPKLCAAVALGQLERMEELIEQRVSIAQAYQEVIASCSWLVPQYVPEGSTCSYWTYVVKLDHPTLTWHEFRDKYMEFGGDGIYAAWKLTYFEDFFQTMNLGGREQFFKPPFFTGMPQAYVPGLCPVAEKLQPKLLQFKTNYFEVERFQKQLEALKQTIAFFEAKAV